MSNQVYIPMSMSYEKTTKLILINFTDNQDEFYNALELQYLQNKRYRILAYCHDGYVDVIDDEKFDDSTDEKFEVAGKGLKNYSKSSFKNISFEKVNSQISVRFKCIDFYKRNIFVSIEEVNNDNGIGLSLLAPIGCSSKNPKFLPLYMLYDFDFICANSKQEITIDKKKINTKKLPFLKGWKKRMFTRYSFDTMLIRFAEDTYKPLVVNGTNDEVEHDQMKLYFCGRTERVLKKIELLHPVHTLHVDFDPPIPNLVNAEDTVSTYGKIEVVFDEEMGSLGGQYIYKKCGNQVSFSMKMNRWKANPKSLIERFMFNKNTVFSKWTSDYEYEQIIDLKKWNCITKWKNRGIK